MRSSGGASNIAAVSLKLVAGILGLDKLLACLAIPVVAACTGSAQAKEAQRGLPLRLTVNSTVSAQGHEQRGGFRRRWLRDSGIADYDVSRAAV